MHRLIKVNSFLGESWKLLLNRTKTIKVVVALLVALIVLTISVSSAQNLLPMKVGDTTLASGLPANVVWAKTYGGSADDRAFYAVPTGNGFLVAGSTRSIAANTTVGWHCDLTAKVMRFGTEPSLRDSEQNSGTSSI